MSIQSVADGLLFPFQLQIESAPDLGLRLALDFQAHGVHLTARFTVEGRHLHPKDRSAVHELQLGGITGDLHRLHRCRVEILQHGELEQTCNLFGTHPDLHLFLPAFAAWRPPSVACNPRNSRVGYRRRAQQNRRKPAKNKKM
ncbi:hypothetical protein [Bifidobacterium longum]|uniref:hypothetical protein n=1 Tax=Bifidobacterium longum TaxID=216816 RepID=UPI0035635E0B